MSHIVQQFQKIPICLGCTLMIICPVITYGSIVWWTRVRLNTAEKELIKLQRMICIAMSGCIRTIPTASFELLLDLFSHSTHIEAEAIMCMKGFRYLEHWKAFSDHLSWNNLDARNLRISFDEHVIECLSGMCLSEK